MLKAKINGKRYSFPSVSELTFEQFNKILIKGEANDLPKYLSVFTDIPLDDLLTSKFSTASLPALHASIFDVDPSEVMKDRKETLRFRDKYISMSSIEVNTMIQSYFFDLYRMRESEGKITKFQLCLYCLAIGLMESSNRDISQVEGIYKDLSQMNWVQVLPQAFFLTKTLRRWSLFSMRIYLGCIWGLKALNYTTRLSRKLYEQQEKKG